MKFGGVICWTEKTKIPNNIYSSDIIFDNDFDFTEFELTDVEICTIAQSYDIMIKRNSINGDLFLYLDELGKGFR